MSTEVKATEITEVKATEVKATEATEVKATEVRHLESGPVLVVQCSPNCGPCAKLTEAWPETSARLIKTFPSLRLLKYTIETSPEKKLPQGLPADLARFQFWYPTILLIPGPIWDKVIKNPQEKFSLVKVFNAKIEDNKILPVKQYETDAEGLGKFIDSSFFENREFCKEQVTFTKTFVFFDDKQEKEQEKQEEKIIELQ